MLQKLILSQLQGGADSSPLIPPSLVIPLFQNILWWPQRLFFGQVATNQGMGTRDHFETKNSSYQSQLSSSGDLYPPQLTCNHDLILVNKMAILSRNGRHGHQRQLCIHILVFLVNQVAIKVATLRPKQSLYQSSQSIPLDLYPTWYTCFDFHICGQLGGHLKCPPDDKLPIMATRDHYEVLTQLISIKSLRLIPHMAYLH